MGFSEIMTIVDTMDVPTLFAFTVFMFWKFYTGFNKRLEENRVSFQTSMADQNKALITALSDLSRQMAVSNANTATLEKSLATHVEHDREDHQAVFGAINGLRKETNDAMAELRKVASG